MSLALMYLSNEREVVLVGGNSHLVIYSWEEIDDKDVLVEHFRAPFVNVVDIVVCDTWFAIKYKRKRVKLFRVVVDAGEFEIREGFQLQLRPFKSRFRTLQIHRFRRRQLIIMDISFESDGRDVQLEIFDLQTKRSIALETLGLAGGAAISALAYTPLFRQLAVFDEEGQVRLFRFKKDGDQPNRTDVEPMDKVQLKNEGFVTRAVMNPAQKMLVLGTAKGEVLFYEVEQMKLHTRLEGLEWVVDLMVCEQVRETILYTVQRGQRDMVKFVLEPVLGNFLMNRFEVKNPIYQRGGPSNPRRGKAEGH